MVGVVAYALVDVVLQFLPPYYSPISDAESNLAVGPYGWLMNLNFLGRAGSTLCIVVAIASVDHPAPRPPTAALRRAGLVFLALGGASSAVLAFFPTDIGLPGSTVPGIVHLWTAGVGFGSAVFGLLTLTRWLHRSPHFAGATVRGTLTLVTISMTVAVLGLAALLVTLSPFPARVGLPELVGIAERICLVGLLAWVYFVGAGIRRRPERAHARDKRDNLNI